MEISRGNINSPPSGDVCVFSNTPPTQAEIMNETLSDLNSDDESVYSNNEIYKALLKVQQQDDDTLPIISDKMLTFAWALGTAVCLGIDCEYVFDAINKRNQVISYQYCLIVNSIVFKGIIYPKSLDDKHRLKFTHFIGYILHQAKKEDVISEYPETVYIFGHFLRADFTHFADFWSAYKTTVSGMRRTITSLKDGYGVNIDAVESRKAGNEPVLLRDQNRKGILCGVRFIDTLPLTPNGAGLSAVGELIGLPKLELPAGYTKDNMLKFKEEQRALFEEYAIRDAEIAVRYGMRMLAFSEDLKLGKLPATIGAISVSIFKRTLQSDETLDYKLIFGLVLETTEHWNKTKGRPHTTKQLVPSPTRILFEELAIRCYHGGRNECFTCGPSLVGEFFDFDLQGAYTTGMCDLLILDYGKAYMVTDPHEFKGHTCGFALVNFKFPAATRFPCLPVRHQRYGLIFPISGTSYCTAPEIEVALNLGCEIEIVQGVIIPWVSNSKPVFEPFVRLVRQKRNSYPKKSFEELLWKEIGNSLYGKTGQGLKERTAFDTTSGLSKKIPPSAITNPYMASHTTGFIRAVISEILASIPSNRSVISVTTDGFLTDATEAELDLTGPVCSRFNQLCQLIQE